MLKQAEGSKFKVLILFGYIYGSAGVPTDDDIVPTMLSLLKHLLFATLRDTCKGHMGWEYLNRRNSITIDNLIAGNIKQLF